MYVGYMLIIILYTGLEHLQFCYLCRGVQGRTKAIPPDTKG